MLVAIQTSGSQPPLFFVHGVQGVMVLGPTFAAALGPNQPLYILNANGIDGRRPVIDNVPDMVLHYVREIEETRPEGPLRIGGMCSGGLVAIEIARNLQERGRQVGAVILADPPPVPFSYDKQSRAVDLRQPQVAQQLYDQVRRTLLDYASRTYNHMPFDTGDPQQVHAATLAGVGSLVALAKYIPMPFSGPAELIISAQRAAAFFHPQMPWHRLLPGPRVVHVLPWNHIELFRSGREAVARLLKFILDEPPALGNLAELRAERSVA
jgi:thioesterase domain-containing protein